MFKFEYDRLCQAGRKDLAKEMEDHRGYDIRSFEPDNGAERLLETSLPGVFAAGDVRSGSTKRCAPAFGEGAMAVTLVHRYLEAQ